MIVSIELADGEINREEWLFFLRRRPSDGQRLSRLKKPVQIDWITTTNVGQYY